MRIAEPCHRGVGNDLLSPRSETSVGVVEQVLVLVGWEKTRADAVDADPAWSPFAGQELGEIDDGRFGRRVGYDARKGYDSRHRGDVDDAPGIPEQHRFAEDLTRQNRATDEVQVKNILPGIERKFAEIFSGLECRGGLIPPCGVDENIDRSHRVFDMVAGLGQRVSIQSIGRDEDPLATLAADVFGPFHAPLGVATQDRDARACRGERIGHRSAEGTGSTDDDSDAVFQRKKTF